MYSIYFLQGNRRDVANSIMVKIIINLNTLWSIFKIIFKNVTSVFYKDFDSQKGYIKPGIL